MNLKQQHQVVSKKVLQLILEHQNSCNAEFENMTEILEQVKITLELCRNSRKELRSAGKQFSSSLLILANYRKRKIAQNLLNNLNMIKDLVSKIEQIGIISMILLKISDILNSWD